MDNILLLFKLFRHIYGSRRFDYLLYLSIYPFHLVLEMLTQIEKLLNQQLKQKQQAQSVSGYDFYTVPMEGK